MKRLPKGPIVSLLMALWPALAVASEPHSVTGNFGSPSQSWDVTSDAPGYATADAGLMFAAPFTTPTPSSGSVGLEATCGIYVVADAGSGGWGCALYTDDNDSPGERVCGATTTATPTNAAWNTLTMSGCPATLSSGTKYWVASTVNNSSTKHGLLSFFGPCPSGQEFEDYGNNPVSFGSTWPANFKAASGGVSKGWRCRTASIPLTWTSSNDYDIVNVYPSYTQGQNGGGYFATSFGSDHTLIVATYTQGGNNPVTVKDSLGNVVPALGTCSLTGGVCLFAEAPPHGITGYTVHQAQTPGDGRQCTAAIELASASGTAPVFDTGAVAYDTSLVSTPFTSGTVTTHSATEFLVGADLSYYNTTSVGTWSSSNGWDVVNAGATTASDQVLSGCGLFTKTVTSQGSYSVSGGWSQSPQGAVTTLGNHSGLAAFVSSSAGGSPPAPPTQLTATPQ
jgi:hypothetical protein